MMRAPAWMRPSCGARGAFRLVVPLLLLAGLTTVHATKRAAEWIDFAHHEARAGRHEIALAAVDSALVREPGDFGARLLKARLLSWTGRFTGADSLLADLARERPDDQEVRLAISSLRYYQGRHREAVAGFRAVVAASPGNGDARKGLALAERALAASVARPAPVWRVDAGGEYSVFTRRTQPDWNQQFASLARRFPAEGEDPSLLVVHAKVERYERYELEDWSMEAGVHRDFSSRWRASVAGGWTPAADFRPDWRVGAAAEWLGLPRVPAGHPARPAAWLLAHGRYDVYDEDGFFGLQPGARLEWTGGWSLTGKMSRVIEIGAETTTGWSLRADGTIRSPAWGPLRENTRVWVGAADDPEAEVLGGTTTIIATRTVFAGFGLDLTGDWSLLFGYARDDREASWVRHVFNAGFTRAF